MGTRNFVRTLDFGSSRVLSWSGLTNLQIERERADLSVQVIQLQERLEEAECGVEGQVRKLRFKRKTSL